MKKRIFIFSFLILAILGVIIFGNPVQFVVKGILKLTGDYATPQYETSESILSKVRSQGLYYDRLFKLKDYSDFHELQEKKLTTVPFVQIYNGKKKLLKIASGSECSWQLMNFFSKKDTANLVAGDSLMYDFVMNRLTPLDIKSTQDTFNYYILAGWANYIPKLSDSLFIQTNKMKKIMEDKVCFSYINFDLQDTWKSEMDSLDHLN
ncbi:MAG: hypothetical protein WBB31_13425 [Saprospiraceae bacterium]